MTKKLTTPLTDATLADLRVGDEVSITGVLYTARDAAHRRMIEALEVGQALPFDIRGQIVYYVGPTPPRPGQVIGSAGPTTSMRMDQYTEPLLKAGLKGIIGKGGRGPQVREALKKYRAVYFGAIGGAGALLSRQIVAVQLVAYEDLGTEAIRRLEVVDFPAIVVNDIHGGDLLVSGKEAWKQGVPSGG